MQFQLTKATEILTRTPPLLKVWLTGLSDSWMFENEGKDTWSPYDVLGHLIQGERVDWIPRAKIILDESLEHKMFEPFDRHAQLQYGHSRTMDDMLTEFEKLRSENLDELAHMKITSAKLKMRGIHPSLGTVTLKELLSTWVAHDLTHIAQIARVMGHQYRSEVGPWKVYIRILNS
jgi:hypothetical protein